MSNVTVSSIFADERAAWDAEIELERLGLDASHISVAPTGRHVPTGDVVGPRLGGRATSAAVATGIVAAVLGALVAGIIGGHWLIGAAFAGGLGALAGAYWGVATRLPVNAGVLDAADDDAALVRVAVDVEPAGASEVIEVLVAAAPVRPPTIDT